MARLSTEHYGNQQSITPKANRFSKMFRSVSNKHLSSPVSSSPESSPSTGTHDKLKKGFTKVGLYPFDRVPWGASKGDRTVEDCPRTPRSSLAEQEQQHKESSAPHSLDTSPGGTMAKNSGKSPMQIEFERKSKTLGTSREDKYNVEDGEVTAIYVGNDRVVPPREHVEKEDKRTEPVELSEAELAPALNNTRAYEDTFHIATKNSSTPRLLGSRSHYWNDMLGVLAEADAKVERSSKPASQEEAEVNQPLSSSKPSSPKSLSAVASSIELPSVSVAIYSCFQDRSQTLKIGPYHIRNQKTIINIQRGVTVLYLTITVSAVLLGPKAFLKLLWIAGPFFILYTAALEILGWKDEQSPDALLDSLYDGVLMFIEVAGLNMGVFFGRIIGSFVAGLVAGYEEAAS